MTDKPDLLTFVKRLEDSEVGCKANIASTGKMNGFSFEYRNIAFKASQLGKAYSWVNLQKQLNYNQNHLEVLRATKEAIPIPVPVPVPVPVPIESTARTTAQSESIGEKIAEIEQRLREDRRNEIVEKILQKNAVKQQKHLRLIGWLPFLRRLAELLRSYGKSILHKPLPGFSKLDATRTLHKGRKIHL